MPTNTEGTWQQSVAAGTTAQGAGTALDNGGTRGTHTMVITVSTGTFTSGTVTLQYSLDNVNWISVATPPTLSSNGTFAQTVNAAAQFVRANVTAAIVGGCTVGVTVASA